VTIAQNTFHGNSISGALLSILNVADGSAIIKRNIFEQNSNANCFIAFRDLNQVESVGNMIDSSTDTCGVDPSRNFINEEANVLPLADNGGPTPTHFLPLNSPARDRIVAPSNINFFDSESFDQKHMIFGQDSHLGRSHTLIDVGAVEADTVIPVSDSFNAKNKPLSNVTQEDFYSVHLEEGQSIKITANAFGNLNTIRATIFHKNNLFDSLGQSPASNNGTNATLEFVATEKGEYWFLIATYDSSTSTYDLSVRVDRKDDLCP